MPRKRTTHLAIQVAVCDLCHRTVDPIDDCWCESRSSGSRIHAHCLAALGLVEDEPSTPPGEVADRVNASAVELCVEVCQNPEHAGRVFNGCRAEQGGDGWIVRPDYAVGCAPDEPQDWAFDHFHAARPEGNGRGVCLCRHDTAHDARRAHDLPVEG